MTVVIIDDDTWMVYTYQGVNADKLREICEEHSMNLDAVTHIIDEGVKMLGANKFMFQLPMFNKNHDYNVLELTDE